MMLRTKSYDLIMSQCLQLIHQSSFHCFPLGKYRWYLLYCTFDSIPVAYRWAIVWMPILENNVSDRTSFSSSQWVDMLIVFKTILWRFSCMMMNILTAITFYFFFNTSFYALNTLKLNCIVFTYIFFDVNIPVYLFTYWLFILLSFCFANVNFTADGQWEKTVVWHMEWH